MQDCGRIPQSCNNSVENCIDNDLEINSVNTTCGTTPPYKITSAPALKEITVVDNIVASLTKEEYDEYHLRIAQFLQTLQTPIEIPRNNEKSFHMEATKYHLVQAELFRQGTRGRPSMRAICGESRQFEIMMALHDESGHRGRDGTAKKISVHY